MKTKLWLVGLVVSVFGVAPASAWAGSISGHVTVEAGAPSENVTVCADGPIATCVGVAPGNEYTVSGLPAGEYRVEFRGGFEGNLVEQLWQDTPYWDDATLVTVGAGTEDVTGVDAEMHLGAELKGTVTDALGTPLEGAEACFVELGGAERSRCAPTDSNGEWVHHGLVPGAYKVYFTGPSGGPAYVTSYYDGKATEAEAETLTLAAGESLTADASLALAGGIEGTLTGDGEPLSFAEVCIHGPSGPALWCEFTGPAGEYSFNGLAAGPYVLEYIASGYTTEYSGGVREFAAATPVQVEAGHTISVPFDLQGPPSIKGTVTDAGTGEPIPNAEACAFSDAGTNCVLTDSQGRYTIGVEPGTYELYFEGGGYVRQFYDGVFSAAEATPVTVGTTAVGGIDAALEVGGSISGHTTLASDGSNLRSIVVCAIATGIEECAGSNTSGNYEIKGLPAGAYKVRFERTGYYRQYWNGKPTLAEAETVTVTAGQTTTGVNAAMAKKEKPAVTTVPTVSGVGKIGETLSCTQGAWTENPTSYKYFWYRGTTEIASAHASTYTLVSGDDGAEYRCGVSATNSVGTTGPVKSATAIGVAAIHPLTVTVAGNGSVSASSGPVSGCTATGGTCSGDYEEGTEVTLTATPGAHQQLLAWVGCTSESGDQCTVKVENLEEVAVQFVPILRALEVTKTGAGSGTVTATNGSILCGPDCGVELEEGTVVTLEGTAEAGSVFTGWSGGGCSGTGSCQVTLGGDTEVVAGFAVKALDDGGTQPPPSSGGSGAPSGSGMPATPAPTTPVKKPLQCKKGFKKVKVGGKARCVKQTKKPKKKGGGKG